MVFVGAGFGECPLRSFADGGSGSLSDGGIASAALWFMSARVDFPFGFDIDAELKDAMRQASKLNARAAACAGLSILGPVAKTLLAWSHLIG